jgi:hypothetical protein
METLKTTYGTFSYENAPYHKSYFNKHQLYIPRSCRTVKHSLVYDHNATAPETQKGVIYGARFLALFGDIFFIFHALLVNQYV